MLPAAERRGGFVREQLRHLRIAVSDQSMKDNGSHSQSIAYSPNRHDGDRIPAAQLAGVKAGCFVSHGHAPNSVLF
jgi:hypothetical protein